MCTLLNALLVRLRPHPSTATLQAFCDGELDTLGRRDLLGHISVCARCANDVESRLAIESSLGASASEPGAHEIADLRGRLFDTVDAIGRQALEQDLEYLLGHSAISEIGTPALDRRLTAFLGAHAASRLRAAWSLSR